MKNKKGDALVSTIFALAGIIVFFDVLLFGTFGTTKTIKGIEIILGVVFIFLSVIIQFNPGRRYW